ncbi:MAG: PKD domain-containing protein, partial [Cyclobacteriaceae bacterium]|nr:PKD domain-containing protein [Cyclobacteriaceae bacterium]
MGSTFSWVALPNGSVGGETTTPPQTGPFITDRLNNVTSTNQTVLYNVTPLGVNGCTGPVFQISVIVKPEPVGTTTSALTICSGSPVLYNLQSNINGNNALPSSFTWVAAANPNVTGESTSLQTTSTISDVLVNTTFIAQTVSYTVNPTGLNGCAGDAFTITVQVNPKAQITAGPDLALCSNVPSIALQGVITYAPAGVQWTGGAGGYSGAGTSPTSSYSFVNPTEINQTLTLTLTAIDPDGGGPCLPESDQMTLKINALPAVFFTGLPPITAENSPPVLLSGNQRGGLFSISPVTSSIGSTSINPSAGDEATLDPSAVTLGFNTVTYSFTDINSCSNQTSQTFLVNPVSIVDFALQYTTGPLAGSFIPLNGTGGFELCGNVGLVKIVGNPVASSGLPPTFFVASGANASTLQAKFSQVGPDYFFDTNGLPSDTYFITYTYTNSFGATSSPFTRAVKIYASPVSAIITPTNSCIISAIDLNSGATMSSPNPYGGNIISWNWNFGDGTFGAGPITSHVYASSGTYNVQLNVVTNHACASSSILSIRVGDVPVVNFDWSAICNNDKTKFVDRTNPGSISVITNYTWDFGDGNIVSGPPGGTASSGNTTGLFQRPDHSYNVFGTYNAKLTVGTNDGCTNSLTRRVFILPYSTVTPVGGAAYTQDFEASTGGWVPEAFLAKNATILNPIKSDTSWVYGIPGFSTIKPYLGSPKAWWTGKDNVNKTYYPYENSVVNGPCFNLSQLKRPMINLDYWSDTERGIDGVTLQYSTDAGITWRIIGPPEGLVNRDQGVDWFNGSGISSNPGSQPIGQYGWTDKLGGWKNGRFNLDMIPVAQRTQVRIRVALGSNDSNPQGTSYDGFAFDNIYVGEKLRNVLVEHFTNSSVSSSVDGDTYINNLYQNQLTIRGLSDFSDI